MTRHAHLLPALLLFSLCAFAAAEADMATTERPAPARSVVACQDLLRRPAQSTPALTSPLRVAVWNSMKFEGTGAAELLRNLSGDKDLVLLQESLREGAGSGRTMFRHFADGYGRAGWQSGVEIRSRVRADVTCSLSFLEPWLRSPKAISVGRYPLAGGRSLLVTNLHAINFTLGTRDYRQQLDAIGALLNSHHGPAIVGGDFNNWNARRDEVLSSFARGHALHKVPINPDWRSRHVGRAIDALYVRGLRAITATALPTESSDHHPIMAVLVPEAPHGGKHDPVPEPSAGH